MKKSYWQGLFRKIVQHKIFLVLLLVVLATHLSLLFVNRPVVWDEAVYVGMAKYFSSGGMSGLFEPIRAPLLPLMLSLSDKPLLFGRFFLPFFIMGILTLTYLISLMHMKKEYAVAAPYILYFTTAFIDSSHRVLTEMPAIFFMLLSVYVLLRNEECKNARYVFIAGVIAGITFLFRFPFALLGLITLIYFSYKFIPKKNYNILFYLITIYSTGFLMVAIPFFIINGIAYSNITHSFFKAMLYPISRGNKLICCGDYVWLYNKGLGFYLIQMLRENIILFVGLIPLFFKKHRQKTSYLLISALVMFIYFNSYIYKTERYMLAFLPFFAILVPEGLMIIRNGIVKSLKWSRYENICRVRRIKIGGLRKLIRLRKTRKRKTRREIKKTRCKIADYMIVLLVVLSFTAPLMQIDSLYFKSLRPDASQLFYDKAAVIISGVVISTSPFIALYSNATIIPAYDDLSTAISSYDANKNAADYIIYDSTSFPCPKDDYDCISNKRSFLELLNAENRLVLETNYSYDDYSSGQAILFSS